MNNSITKSIPISKMLSKIYEYSTTTRSYILAKVNMNLPTLEEYNN
jgi:hypothetical protein